MPLRGNTALAAQAAGGSITTRGRIGSGSKISQLSQSLPLKMKKGQNDSLIDDLPLSLEVLPLKTKTQKTMER